MMPPVCMACSACFTTRHGSGRSSSTRSMSVDLDALVHVADFDGEGHIGPEETLDVRLGPAREVVTDLVAGDPPARPDRASSASVSAPEPTPDSRTFAPGKMSARIRIGPRSFG